MRAAVEILTGNDMNSIDRAREILDIEIEQLQVVRNSLGEGFARAVSLILECLGRGGKIVVTGVGKSYHIGQKISGTLSSTGSTSVSLHASQAAHGDLGILNRADVLLAISFSGESDELTAILPYAKREGIRVIAVTGAPGSSIARLCDEIIVIPVQREACPFNLAPTASTTATLAVGDALAIVLLEARGFGREDYARLHPGGAIGSALLLKVSDFMRKDQALAMVRTGAKVRDAILAMTTARAGCVGVVDADGRVSGIFTDGDLRRLLTGGTGDVSEVMLESVMTKAPITVRESDLAVTVLKVFEEHRIDDLLVVDGDGRLVGLVDIQDLPRCKIL